MDFDLTFHVDNLPVLLESSISEEKVEFESSKQSNCLSLMFIKAHVCKSKRNSIFDCLNVKDFMKAIKEQFVTSEKLLANALIKNSFGQNFSSF